MSSARYVVGIDLGTTNTAVSLVDTQAAEPVVEQFHVPQLVAPGQVVDRPLLPSFLYLPGAHELPEGSLALPWDPDSGMAVGEFARDHGAKLPHRLVSSAKSWLCHSGVDRRGEILPWDTQGDVERISPLAASAMILGHVRDAFNKRFASEDPSLALEAQDVVITVPASFDAVARELTVEAARNAGLLNVTLLEEPQAAFYAWLEWHPDTWRDRVGVGDAVLVCDIGGGTTDFCLIAAAETEGSLELSRVAVGEHLLLGGDNMDLALALSVQADLEADGKSLDAWQLTVLTHMCRQAKEQLLEDSKKSDVTVTIPGRGSSVIGGSLKAKLARSTLNAILVDGFFPECEVDDRPIEQSEMGLHELGLPYAPDAAMTKWLARFLGDHKKATSKAAGSATGLPTAILFNGGVLRSKPLRQRVLDVVAAWAKEAGVEPARELENPDPSLAVARGAAYYGLVRRGKGVRIRGGAARSYYIGVEAARPAVPGVATPVSGLCVAPRGMEEGTSIPVPGREFGLTVGTTARFRFFSSTTRKDDGVGTVVTAPEKSLHEGDPLEATLPAGSGTGRVPVRLESSLTEVGTLELWFVERSGDQRWKLEFNVREKPAPKSPAKGKRSA